MEYALLIAAIVAVLIAVLIGLGSIIRDAFGHTATCVSNDGTPTACSTTP